MGSETYKNFSLEEAEAFCRELAKTHYENFTVCSFLVPANKRQHLYNIYAFCRWSDDLGDELAHPQESLQALLRWREELDACYEGKARHPVFIALRVTIARFAIPKKPFADLIEAFTLDQTQPRWPTFEDLLSYCERSANPVGRLFLYLFDIRDPERQKLADFTCTALQLTNFWQDISIDLDKGRIYLPLEDMERFGIGEDDLRAQRCDQRFQELMKFEVNRTREFFQKGRELISVIPNRLRIDVSLFSLGGEKILDRIEKARFDVFQHRPKLSRWDKACLILRSFL